MEVEAPHLYQSQDSKFDEETNLAMVESLVYSGIQSLAERDESISIEREKDLKKVVKEKLPSGVDNDGTKVGKELAYLVDEIDGIISNSYIDRIVGTLTNETVTNELTKFFKEATQTVINHKGGVTEGCILVIVMFGYRLVRRYLELFLGESILKFIEDMVKVIYEIFKEFGILSWIASIGGWAALAARGILMENTILHQISDGLIRSLWGVLGVGAAAATAFCIYKAISG